MWKSSHGDGLGWISNCIETKHSFLLHTPNTKYQIQQILTKWRRIWKIWLQDWPHTKPLPSPPVITMITMRILFMKIILMITMEVMMMMMTPSLFLSFFLFHLEQPCGESFPEGRDINQAPIGLLEEKIWSASLKIKLFLFLIFIL